jgi:hypothetical protein
MPRLEPPLFTARRIIALFAFVERNVARQKTAVPAVYQSPVSTSGAYLRGTQRQAKTPVEQFRQFDKSASGHIPLQESYLGGGVQMYPAAQFIISYNAGQRAFGYRTSEMPSEYIRRFTVRAPGNAVFDKSQFLFRIPAAHTLLQQKLFFFSIRNHIERLQCGRDGISVGYNLPGDSAHVLRPFTFLLEIVSLHHLVVVKTFKLFKQNVVKVYRFIFHGFSPPLAPSFQAAARLPWRRLFDVLS